MYFEKDSINQKEKSNLIILYGIPLTGKTYTAKKIQEKYFNVQHRDVDQYRQFFEKKKSNILFSKYEEKIMMNCYKSLCKDAYIHLINNQSIIISGTFSKDCFKTPLKKLVKKLRNKHNIICIELQVNDKKEIEKRIERRLTENSLSNINSIDKYEWAKSIFKPISFLFTYIYDTSKKDYIYRMLKLLDTELN